MRHGAHEITDDAIVESVMTRDPKTVAQDDPVQRAAQIMREEECGIVPVTDKDDRLAGVVTDRDVVVRVVAEGDDPKKTRVDKAMTQGAHTARPEDPVTKVLHIMQKQQVRRVPVVDGDGRLVGIVSLADVTQDAPVSSSAVGRTVEEISEDRGRHQT